MGEGENSYRLFMNGDLKAFEELVVLYRKSLMLFLNGYVHSLSVAEDLTSDVFLDLYVHKIHFSKNAGFKTFLFTIGRNKAVDYLRKNSHNTNTPLDENRISSFDDILEFEDELFEGERKKALYLALDELNSDYRAVIHLIYFEDMSNKDAAKTLKKSQKQIYNILYRAKQQLKNSLEKELIFNEK